MVPLVACERDTSLHMQQGSTSITSRLFLRPVIGGALVLVIELEDGHQNVSKGRHVCSEQRKHT